ncbi:SMP-30/gluconolactonase/LRE family protein [Duganella sp. LX20W]|uniref:SMP-30/gluconolactonase/LRE family protein n=1 Tax=Rugamonas brunnea TaxID=2758569 RepID=A0A7W2I9V6_9BURK|nr:SMP-30/gluconolactonase/LRE family protein [Rugamonas brunnea]MBA5635549.1 SMP-30/gluconolactonase/LRE family protein [Rugamonas brunnea]
MVAALPLLVDACDELGEGVLWCERSARVYWTDIHGARLHSYSPATGEHRLWPLPERLCSFALTADPDLLLAGLASRLAWLDLRGGTVTTIMAVEPDLPHTRVNDGRCDRQGRFVFGTLDERAEKQAIGGYYRLNTDLTLERLPLPACAIANSICFGLDGDTMYYSDTLRQTIERWDGYGSSAPARTAIFADLRGSDAWPDGSIIDAQGYLWNAQWGASRVARYAPDGTLAGTWALPVSQPSCPCLGGAGLDQLFVTTAWEGMDAQTRAAQAQAGGLFGAVLEGARGVPEPRFGALP